MSHLLGWVLGAAVAAVCIAVPVWWLQQPDASSHVPDQPAPFALNLPETDGPPRQTEFATGNEGKNDVVEAKFDGERALKYLKQLCDIGPRISGSEGMKKQQEIVEKHFKDLGATVARQEFKARQRSRKEATDMVNLVISWHPEKTRRVLICSHYDTRPIADQEANRNNWNKPFVSANDGTSGVAFLMELGNHMKDLKCEYGVDFILFDGEEYVFETTRGGDGDKYFFGSEHFAKDYLESKDKRKFRYEAGLLLDLFAARDARLRVEQYSYAAAPKLVEQLWSVARQAGVKSFVFEAGYEVQDDHLALLKVGIPTIDLIDFDYPHWHKLSDTLDKVSGSQMADVSKVITLWLQKIK
jgi:hypothetical protein